MMRKILLPTIFALLAYGFWLSPNFKEIASGVAIFLFGMLSLEEGFKALTGGVLENWLRRSTNSLSKSLCFGFFSTSVMQSSSLVSVIAISFLSAGLISLSAGIGIIFGANLGTTTGAWLVAGFGLKVNISAYAMPMIVFGVILLFQKSKELRGIGYVLTGLGFLFLGIHYMKEGFESFSGSIDLKAYAVEGYAGIFLFVLIGLVATVVMQSSHATLVLIITALAANQITYENALALAIGANVGTTVTAILGAMSANVEGRRLAVAHLVFNLVTAAIAISLIYQLTNIVDVISQNIGIAEQNYMLKLAVFHTIFNTIGVIVMTPFIVPLVGVLEKVVKPINFLATQSKYLKESALDYPETAVAAIRNEMLRLYDQALDIIALGLRIKPTKIRAQSPIDEVVARADFAPRVDIDELYRESIKDLYSMIVDFGSKAQARNYEVPNGELFVLRTAGKYMIEAIKDTKHLQKNLNQYLDAENQRIQEQYNTIRIKLVSLLVALERVRSDSDDSAIILSLDHLKIEAHEQDKQFDEVLDKLIREHKITPQMATSLMNDKSYADNIADKLIAMARVLFSTGDSMTRAAERSMSMGEYELGAAVEDFEGSVRTEKSNATSNQGGKE